jgi:hypothetical protein
MHPDRARRAGPFLSHHPTLASSLACLVSYLYGSLPVVYALGRWKRVDLASTGSSNVGSANLWASAGILPGVLGWLFDASKGFVPVTACRRLGLTEESAALAGSCGVAGQCWPIFLRFNGGRGISAWVGAGAAIDRPVWAVSLFPLIGGGLLHALPALRQGPRSAGNTLRAGRGTTVPLGCLAAVLAFPGLHAIRARRAQQNDGLSSRVPVLLALLIVLRRLSASQPDDPAHGPSVYRRALLYRLLYDRNTGR